MDNQQHHNELVEKISHLDQVIDRIYSRSYCDNYRREQKKDLVRYFLTRKLPKNKEWMFTYRKVGIPIVYISRMKTRYSLKERLSYMIELSHARLYFVWKGHLPRKFSSEEIGTRISVRTKGITVPHRIREDTEEHRIMLQQFKAEMEQLARQALLIH